MKKKLFFAIDRYTNRVFQLVILALPFVALCSCVTFTLLKVCGYYPSVSRAQVVLFDASGVLYLILGILFRKFSVDERGIIKPRALTGGKVLLAVLEVVHWNVISYLFPSSDFWAFAVFFALLVAVFLDYKYVLAVVAGISVSIAVSWFLNGEALLPSHDGAFVPNIVLRVVFLTLSFACICVITYLIQSRLASELEHSSIFDELTKLYNRKSMDWALEQFIYSAELDNRFSVVMCDIDDFKAVNDSYGHLCGDEILKMIADIMTKSVGDKGIVVRYGGEEILLFLRMEQEQATKLAERIRKEVEASSVSYEGKTVAVTVTMGLTDNRFISETEELISMADKKMYYGKQHGKNTVVV